jgi:hypothetical protein
MQQCMQRAVFHSGHNVWRNMTLPTCAPPNPMQVTCWTKTSDTQGSQFNFGDTSGEQHTQNWCTCSSLTPFPGCLYSNRVMKRQQWQVPAQARSCLQRGLGAAGIQLCCRTSQRPQPLAALITYYLRHPPPPDPLLPRPPPLAALEP